MALLDSVRVLGAMVRVTVPTVTEALRGTLQRDTVDERTRWFGHRVVELLDIELTSTGAGRIDPDRAYVYLSNHQSHLDIPILYATLPSPTIRMLAKSELFRIPIWGQGLRAAEFVAVDRGNPERARASIEVAARLLRTGVSIYLAPEGTRSRDGTIGHLKKGGFHLALDTHTPIVPVAIRGTLAILPRGGRVMRTGRAVDVTIGAPIEVEGRTVADLSAEVREFLVEHASGKMSDPG